MTDLPPSPLQAAALRNVTPACAGQNLSTFFPPPGGGPGVTVAAREAELLEKFCRTCPVLQECTAWSLHVREGGYWAGMGEETRRQLAQKLRIKRVDNVTLTYRKATNAPVWGAPVEGTE